MPLGAAVGGEEQPGAGSPLLHEVRGAGDRVMVRAEAWALVSSTTTCCAAALRRTTRPTATRTAPVLVDRLTVEGGGFGPAQPSPEEELGQAGCVGVDEAQRPVQGNPFGGAECLGCGARLAGQVGVRAGVGRDEAAAGEGGRLGEDAVQEGVPVVDGPRCQGGGPLLDDARDVDVGDGDDGAGAEGGEDLVAVVAAVIGDDAVGADAGGPGGEVGVGDLVEGGGGGDAVGLGEHGDGVDGAVAARSWQKVSSARRAGKVSEVLRPRWRRRTRQVVVPSVAAWGLGGTGWLLACVHVRMWAFTVCHHEPTTYVERPLTSAFLGRAGWRGAG